MPTSVPRLRMARIKAVNSTDVRVLLALAEAGPGIASEGAGEDVEVRTRLRRSVPEYRPLAAAAQPGGAGP